jgi:hypothetical protein
VAYKEVARFLFLLMINVMIKKQSLTVSAAKPPPIRRKFIWLYAQRNLGRLHSVLPRRGW